MNEGGGSVAARLLGRHVSLSVVDPSAAPPPAARRPRPPAPPAHLTPAAKKEWRRIVRLVDVSAVDVAAIAVYCQAYARWADAEKQIAEFGMLVRGDHENLVPSPYLKIALDASRQVERMLRVMGFGIAEQ